MMVSAMDDALGGALILTVIGSTYFLIFAVQAVLKTVRVTRLAEIRSKLTQKLVDHGYSASEIERLLLASHMVPPDQDPGASAVAAATRAAQMAVPPAKPIIRNSA
jgi:hypothetical protein